MAATSWTPAALLGLALTAAGLAGCQDEPAAPVTAPAPTVPVDELNAHDGEVCPRRLPEGHDPAGHGLGTEEPASAAPSLREPDAAWVCRYDPVDTRAKGDSDAHFTWVRGGGAHVVPDERLPELSGLVGELVPFDLGDNEYCTADLGPRWLLVLATDGDLTGVSVDDYGCRQVRLTDEPFDTAPGDAEPVGTVPGILETPGDGLLRTLKGELPPG